MITILSPAKSLDFETPRTVDAHTVPPFRSESEALIGELRKKQPEQLVSLMNISEKLAELNFQRFQAWDFPENKATDDTRPALFAFQGDVYQGLQADTLSHEAVQFAQAHLRILSGLHGLLRPLDLIRPYRLEMDTKLPVGRHRHLYTFWGDKIQQKLLEEVAHSGSAVLLNLASNEYFKAVQPKTLGVRTITPVFKERKGDKLQIVSFFAKKARGMMARFVVEHALNEPEPLKAFAEEGYAFDASLSTENEWLFVRG